MVNTHQKNRTHQSAIEDYLKVIYLLEEDESPVSTTRIAETHQVRAASVTNMIQRLAKLDLVHYQKYDGVTLTESGRNCALEVLRHHRLIELYLIKALGFSWDEVHEQADALEHVISEELEERLAAALGNPEYGAYGRPIPTRKGELAILETEPLTDVSVGAIVTVAYIADDTNSELLANLRHKKIFPGTQIHLIEKASISGLITAEINNEPCILGHKTATMIHVQAKEEMSVPISPT